MWDDISRLRADHDPRFRTTGNPIPYSYPSHLIDHFHYIKIHTWLRGSGSLRGRR